MNSNPGRELLNTFQKLGIDLGNCDPNVIEAWFDLDLQNNEFLTWLSKTLTEENCIYEHEIAEYEDNISKKNVPNANEYESILAQTSEKFPGIFDIADTEFEIECLEDELNMLVQHKNQLNNILQLHSNLNKKEKVSLIDLERQYVSATNKLERTEAECLQLSCSLDKINNELFSSIESCSEKLQEYEHPFTAAYISNIPINKYSNQYQQIISSFGLLDRKEFASLPKLQSAVKTCSKFDGSMFSEKSDDTLNTLKKKIFKSIQRRNYTEAVKEQLHAELIFLEQFNINHLTNILRSKKQVEDNIQLKSDQYETLSLELENESLEMSEKYINYPSINIAKQEVKLLQSKLRNLKDVENVFITVLSNHTLLYFMLVINNADVQRSDQFFRSVHSYISCNLTKCESRMDSMIEIIKQHKVYEQIPFHQRSVLLQTLCRLLSGSNVNRFDTDTLISFQKDIHSCNFAEDVQFRQQIRFIEENNNVLKSFLSNGPTSEIISIPYKVYKIISEIDNLLNVRNAIITGTLAVWKNAIKKASETEWFKFKRQLWMYFLIQPQRVLTYIRKIQDEERRINAETM